MHDSKKDADAQDKMLELAEEFTALLEDKVKGIDEKQAEEFGLFLARNKDKLIQACRGKEWRKNNFPRLGAITS
jgi:hypothetical protein